MQATVADWLVSHFCFLQATVNVLEFTICKGCCTLLSIFQYVAPVLRTFANSSIFGSTVLVGSIGTYCSLHSANVVESRSDGIALPDAKLE